MPPKPKSSSTRLFGLSQKHPAGSGVTHKLLLPAGGPDKALKLFLEFLGKRGLSRGQRVIELPRPILSELTLKPGIVRRVSYDKDVPLHWE